VQVLYSEGVATHTGPEPCGVSREGHGEASAGERAGWPLSRERAFSRTPTRLPARKATRSAAIARVAARSGAVKDPSMYGRSLPGNREISWLAGGGARRWSAPGRPQGRSRR
jgi:hypothetical protein